MRKKLVVKIIMGVAIILGIAFKLAVDFGTDMIVKAERKNSDKMLEELYYNFNTDYRDYMELDKEEVSVQAFDGTTLRGVYHNVHKNSDKIVIINHGYTANRYVGYQYVDAFLEEGYNILLIDMRSHGESEGEFASYGYNEKKDLEAWVNFARKKVTDQGVVGIHGQSMGAATALLYSGENTNIDFVISDCGYISAEKTIKQKLKNMNIPVNPLYNSIRKNIEKKYGFDLNTINVGEAVKQSNVPTMFIHGKKDTIVPYTMSEEMFNAKGDEKDSIYLVDDAEHMEAFSSNKEEYQKRIKEFLKNLS